MAYAPPPPYMNYAAPQPQRIIVIPNQNLYVSPARPRGCCHSCGLCCTKCCLFFACLFGLGPHLKRVHRLIISFCTIAGIAITAGLLLGLVTYGSNNFYASLADMRPFDEKYSTSLCDRFEVTRATAPVDVYFFKSMPPIRKNYTEECGFKVNPKPVNRKTSEMVKFYMLKGSEMEVSVKSPYGSGYVVYLIKGAYNLGEWRGDQDCCYLKKEYPSMVFGTYFKYTVKESDMYYITIAARRYFSSGTITANVELVLRKTVYDVSQATAACVNYTSGGSCGVNLDYGSDQVAILYAPQIGHDKYGHQVKNYTVGTYCHPRLLIYIPSFFLAPAVFYALWALMLWFCYPDKQGDEDEHPQVAYSGNVQVQVATTNDRANLVSNQVI